MMSQSKNKKNKLRFAILATDVLLFTVRNGQLLLRLVSVNRPPYFINREGLPGRLVKPTETAGEAARKCLKEKGRISFNKVYFEQLYTFSDVRRDPRGRVVSVAYLGCVAWENLSAKEKTNTGDSYWRPVNAIKKLAYDHNKIVAMGLERLKSKIKYTTLLSRLLPKESTLTDLENLYELILGDKLDKRNFRKKINQLNFLKSTGRKRRGQKSRPALLYKFSSKKVVDLTVIGDRKIS